MKTRGAHRSGFLPGLAILVLLALLASVAAAQTNGSIAGKVTSSEGKALAYANVVIVGSTWGAFTKDDGSFKIVNIPPGTYAVRVTMVGYEDQSITGLVVTAGSTATAEFKIKEKPTTIQEVEIVAVRERIKTKSTQTGYTINTDDAANLPVSDITDLIALKAGVVARADGLHIRGGRAGEVQIQVDGVPVRDPLVGGSVSLAMVAIEDVEQIMGGLDAQYGNAQSAVINYKTREGGDSFEGNISYVTDDYGQPDNTYDNLDRFTLGIGGPSPVKNLTYYISGEGVFQDNYPMTNRQRSRTKILNFISVGDRKSNTVRLQGKLAWRPGKTQKLTAELLNERNRSDVYYHIWSRAGYVATFLDTTRTGEVILRRGRWSPTQLDSSYVYYNAAEHTPNFNRKFGQVKLAWSHALDAATYYSVKLSRNSFYSDTRVQGKEPWEYEGTARDFFFDYDPRDMASSEFFTTGGDYPTLSHRETKVYGSKVDVTRKRRKHTFQGGVEGTYNDMRYYQVDNAYQTSASGEIGTRTRYHYYNPEGGAYLQDKWEHEGMVLNIGLRYDLFSVGQQLSIAEVKERVKKQWSPRVGIAYPISDRDVFSFHYGRFYQIPDRSYIFDDRQVLDGRTRGNANLTNETTVSYQAAIQHLFNEAVSGQFSVYYKDIFGLLTSEELAVDGQVGNVTYWVNRDYASSRGFEATLTRRFANNFSGELNYNFSVATGVASDPAQATQSTFVYLPISEQALDWDVRHNFSIQFVLANPGAWLASFIWSYESGFPYTPWGRNTRELKPEVVNSRRLPSTTGLDAKIEKFYQVWGQRFRVFLDGQNILDTENITTLSPTNFPTPPGRSRYDYEIYYTETGRGGGAYVGEDRTGDGVGDWVPVYDPRVYGSPRAIKVGLSYSF
jgi:outer membrane receptor for ferrienterochelin and colicin